MSSQSILLLIVSFSLCLGELVKQNEIENKITYEESEYRNATESITIKEDKIVIFRVVSNPSTGYIWSFKDELNNVKINQEFVRKNTGMVGSGGYQIFTITPLGKGAETVYFHYKRSWETDFIFEYQFKLIIL